MSRAIIFLCLQFMASLRSHSAALALALALPLAYATQHAVPPAAPDQAIVLIATFEIAPGREQEFKERALAFAAMAQAAEPGVVYRLHVSSERPTSFVFYEFFPSKAAHDRVQEQVGAAHRARYGPTPSGLFVRPPAQQTWLPLN